MSACTHTVDVSTTLPLAPSSCAPMSTSASHASAALPRACRCPHLARPPSSQHPAATAVRSVLADSFGFSCNLSATGSSRITVYRQPLAVRQVSSLTSVQAGKSCRTCPSLEPPIHLRLMHPLWPPNSKSGSRAPVCMRADTSTNPLPKPILAGAMHAIAVRSVVACGGDGLLAGCLSCPPGFRGAGYRGDPRVW